MIIKIETPNFVDGKPVTASKTSITTAGGEPIHGVKSAIVRINLYEVITASLEIISAFRGDAVAEFMVMDPLSGELKAVRYVEFEDGTFFAACEVCGGLATTRQWSLIELPPEIDEEGHANRRCAKDKLHLVCEECKQK